MIISICITLRNILVTECEQNIVKFYKRLFILNLKLYLESINDFSINQTEIESIDLNVFQNLPNVVSVYFSDNKIKKIAQGFSAQYQSIHRYDIDQLPNHLFESIEKFYL